MNNKTTVARPTFEPTGWDLSELLPDSGEDAATLLGRKRGVQDQVVQDVIHEQRLDAVGQGSGGG